MSLGPPPQLRAFRRDGDAPLFFAAGESSRATSRSRCGRNLVSVSYGGFARACCLFSAAGSRSRSKQDEARKAVENALGWKKTGLPKLGMRIERRQQRLPPSAGGGGWSGGGGWFRWFSSGGFWDAAKQTILTIVGIIAAFFLIANFNVLVAAIVNSLLAVLRQIRRALSFVAQCILQGVQSSAPRRSSPSLDTGNQAAVVVKDRVGKSAKERVVRKWGNGV
ncbi:hypothetical protein OsI_32446 [Oryza sativa Indica Group]|uniref:Uncharacterized protein n=1 Tax=Oryza sativa subsp. indica TaxID=39946 RepID=B8BEN1_ORYSI|nr:hypothetical protein OsI_32446 [Oryza sativa Indica Group]